MPPLYFYGTEGSTGGIVSHSVDASNTLSLRIAAPVTDGTNVIASFDNTQIAQVFVKSTADGTEITNTLMAFDPADDTFYVDGVSIPLPGVEAGLQVYYYITITPATGPVVAGGLSATDDYINFIRVTDTLTDAPPPPPDPFIVDLDPPIGVSVQPINTYFQIPVQTDGLTFSDIGLVPFDGTTDINLTLTVNADQVALNLSAGGYTGSIETSSLVATGNEVFLGYNGAGYGTGVTFDVIGPSLSLEPPVITAGVTDGTLLLTFSDGSTYTDTNYPSGTGLLTDGGNMVDVDGVPQTGVTLATNNLVGPATFVVVGYQSASAVAAGGTLEYFVDPEVGITLPGITYTEVVNSTETSVYDPHYEFTGLSVMGQTGATFLSSLYLTTGLTSATFGVTYNEGASHWLIDLAGLTYDISGSYLSYSTGGTTLALPDFPLGLTGTVSPAFADNNTTVVVNVTGAVYGISNTFTLVNTGQGDFDGTTFEVVGGSGGITYIGVVATTYAASEFEYRVVIPSGTSENFIQSEHGIVPSLVNNNGGTGSARLDFNYLFEASAGQTNTFTVLGEAGVTAIAEDETIILDVPIAQMNKLLVYSSNWLESPGATAGEQPRPVVALMAQEFIGSILNDFSQGLTGTTGGITYVSDDVGTIQGSSGSACNSLLYHFQQLGGVTYHDPSIDPNVSTDYLANIPEAAITKVEISALVAPPLAETIGNLIDEGDGTTGPPPDHSEALQSLFEQAVNAGLVQLPPPTALNGEITTTTGYGALGDYVSDYTGNTGDIYGAQWTAGQELALYVQYNLTKTRAYQLSEDISAGATGPFDLNFSGVTFTVGGLSEESTAVPKVYKIILHTVGGGGTPSLD